MSLLKDSYGSFQPDMDWNIYFLFKKIFFFAF